MKPISVFALALSALLFSGCQSESRSLDTHFNLFKQALIAGDNTVLFDQFDEATQEYLSTIAEMALWPEDRLPEKNAFCRQAEHPLSTHLLLQASELMAQLEEAETYGPLKVIFNAQMLKFHFFDEETAQGMTFVEVEEVGENTAQVKVNIPMNGQAKVQSTYTFHFEGDRWRLNLASTLRLSEKILQSQWQKSGLSEREFTEQLLLNGSSGVNVYYRK